MAGLSVGVAATKAPWSSALRSYVRDHTQGIAVEVVMDRTALVRVATKLDVLVVDDIMRIFSITEVAGAQDSGVFVVGLYDESAGLGLRYLTGLGVDQVLPASTAPVELVAFLSQLGPRVGLLGRGPDVDSLARNEFPAQSETRAGGPIGVDESQRRLGADGGGGGGCRTSFEVGEGIGR